jgi:hypothetical protein
MCQNFPTLLRRTNSCAPTNADLAAISDQEGDILPSDSLVIGTAPNQPQEGDTDLVSSNFLPTDDSTHSSNKSTPLSDSSTDNHSNYITRYTCPISNYTKLLSIIAFSTIFLSVIIDVSYLHSYSTNEQSISLDPMIPTLLQLLRNYLTDYCQQPT